MCLYYSIFKWSDFRGSDLRNTKIYAVKLDSDKSILDIAKVFENCLFEATKISLDKEEAFRLSGYHVVNKGDHCEVFNSSFLQPRAIVEQSYALSVHSSVQTSKSLDFIALSTDWIKDYDNQKTMNMLNPLFVSIRKVCEKKNIKFIYGDYEYVKARVH